MTVHNSFVHNCQNMEATQVPFSRWMEKEMAAHTDNGMLFCAWKKWATKPWKDIEETQTHIIK